MSSRFELEMVIRLDQCSELLKSASMPEGDTIFCDENRLFVRKFLQQLVRRSERNDLSVVDDADQAA